MHCYIQCPQPCRGPPPTRTSTGDCWTLPGKSGSVSCGVAAPFPWVLVRTRFCLCPPRVHFPVLCKFWQLCGGVNSDLLTKGLCHTQVFCTQSPWPCGSPLLTHTSTGDTQMQFCLSLCGVSGSWCTQGLFEPSEHCSDGFRKGRGTRDQTAIHRIVEKAREFQKNIYFCFID